MTIRLPRPTTGDKILHMMGKRRAVYLPPGKPQLGPYVTTMAQQESFLKALLRNKNATLPEGWVYLDALQIDGEPQ